MAHQGDLLATNWYKTEAEMFADEAVALGVPRDRILLEPRATNTAENVRFTRELLCRNGDRPRNLVLATKPFMQRHHEAEIGLLAPGEVFLEPSGLLAPKSLFRGIAGRSVAEIAVENDEVLPDGRGGWKINFAGTPLFSQTNRCILIDTEVTA